MDEFTVYPWKRVFGRYLYATCTYIMCYIWLDFNTNPNSLLTTNNEHNAGNATFK